MKLPVAGQYYYHYKHTDQSINNYTYLIVCIAKHRETLEDMVVYQPLYETESNFWVRPANIWFDNIQTQTYTGSRFTLITDQEIISQLNPKGKK